MKRLAIVVVMAARAKSGARYSWQLLDSLTDAQYVEFHRRLRVKGLELEETRDGMRAACSLFGMDCACTHHR